MLPRSSGWELQWNRTGCPAPSDYIRPRDAGACENPLSIGSQSGSSPGLAWKPFPTLGQELDLKGDSRKTVVRGWSGEGTPWQGTGRGVFTVILQAEPQSPWVGLGTHRIGHGETSSSVV